MYMCVGFESKSHGINFQEKYAAIRKWEVKCGKNVSNFNLNIFFLGSVQKLWFPSFDFFFRIFL